MRSSAIYKAAGYLLMLLSVWTMLASCSTEQAKKSLAEMSKYDTMLSTEQGTNVTITYTDSGRLKARIFAPLVMGYKSETDPYVKMPKGVKAEFYSDSGRTESYLEAENGVSYQNRKIVEVTRNVQVRNIKGEKLNTEKLTWDQNKGKIYTDKFVKITTAKEIITGEGMEAKQDFTEWYIKKVKGTISLAKDSTNN